jgi:hypothetical protein
LRACAPLAPRCRTGADAQKRHANGHNRETAERRYDAKIWRRGCRRVWHHADMGLEVMPPHIGFFFWQAPAVESGPHGFADRQGGYPPRAAVFNAAPKFFITSEIGLERAWKI